MFSLYISFINKCVFCICFFFLDLCFVWLMQSDLIKKLHTIFHIFPGLELALVAHGDRGVWKGHWKKNKNPH